MMKNYIKLYINIKGKYKKQQPDTFYTKKEHFTICVKTFTLISVYGYNILKEMINMIIKRENYLKQIRKYYDIDLIKVLTGVRRCGKSKLLEQIIM